MTNNTTTIMSYFIQENALNIVLISLLFSLLTIYLIVNDNMITGTPVLKKEITIYN